MSLTLKNKYPLYLANKAIQPNEDLKVFDKFTGEVATYVALADTKIIDAAIETGFERNEFRPIEFGVDMGTKAVTEKLITLLKDKNVQNEVLT